jgi:Ca2+-binding RTX toxin-like protein
MGGDGGNDTMSGGDGDDAMSGGDDADAMSGGNGADRMEGDDGDDSVDGGAGNDALYGGAGDDSLSGGTNGRDWLDGGEGDDELSGGNQSDTFAFDFSNGGDDTVTDFSIDDDRDLLMLTGVGDLGDIAVHEEEIGGVWSTVLEANGNSLTLVGFSFSNGEFGEQFDSAGEINEYSGTYSYDAVQLA